MLMAFNFTLSCMSIEKPSSDKVKNNLASVFDEQWHKTLIDSKTDLMKAWLKIAPFKDKSWITMRTDLAVSEAEKASLNCIPVETFVIDSLSFHNMNKDTRLESIMKLKKDEATCYLLKDKTFLVAGQFDCKNGLWCDKELGLIDKTRATAFADVYFNKKLPIFEVFVIQGGGYTMPYSAYLENGVMWMVLGNGAKETLKDCMLGDQYSGDEIR